ncbi:Heat shock protein HSP20 [Nitrosopumilaceae archaeon]|nr:Heat shock protein HSP20 [Nitrosopumilaceae archaeon]
MFFDTEIDRLLRGTSIAGLLGELARNSPPGPAYYCKVVSVGPDGTPVVHECGTPQGAPARGAREPVVDAIVDEKAGTIKLIAEMPGVEKTDVRISVDDGTVDLSAERDEKEYRARIPLERKVDEGSARATYKNGILQIVFSLAEEGPAGTRVEVE